MTSIRKLFPRGAVLLAATVALSACEQVQNLIESTTLADPGYDKVAVRVRESIPRPSRPNPPPVVAGVGTGAAAIPTLPAGAAPAGVTQEMVEQGAELYGTICSACHGPAGTGTPAGPALDDADWIHISGEFEEIVNIIRTGVQSPQQFPAAMPPLGGGNFDEEQVRAISAYVFALSRTQS